ncbi:hypothetical protein ACOMHN_011687 [Nucella lapillus]
MDPRRMVNIISRNKCNNQKLKQEAVQDYIDHMAGVDKSDQFMSYTPFHRKTMKWWKKMFFHLFTLSIIQSSILHEIYHTGRGGKKLPLKQFVVRLGLAMNDRYQAGVAAAVAAAAGQAAANPPVPAVAPPAPVPAAAPPPPVPVAAPPPPVPAAVGQTRLVRKTAVCAKCGVPLCDKIIQPQGNGDITCFRLYHTVKNYTDY